MCRPCCSVSEQESCRDCPSVSCLKINSAHAGGETAVREAICGDGVTYRFLLPSYSWMEKRRQGSVVFMAPVWLENHRSKPKQSFCTPPISSSVVRLCGTLRCCHPPAHPGRKSASQRKRSAVKPLLNAQISLARARNVLKHTLCSSCKHRNEQNYNVHEPSSTFKLPSCRSS